MPAIPAESIDLVLCDLPYGVTACSWDKKIPLRPLWDEYLRVTPERGVIALFAQQPFATELAAAAPANLFRHEWIWDKVQPTGFANAHRAPMRRHESVFIFCRKQPPYNPMGLRPCRPRSRTRRDTEVYGHVAGNSVQRFTGYPQSIIVFRRDRGSAPCQKPVALLDYLIQTYTSEGATILDNAMGTGSTGVAAMKAHRNFVGIELDSSRFQFSAARISAVMVTDRKCRPRSFFGKEAAHA